MTRAPIGLLTFIFVLLSACGTGQVSSGTKASVASPSPSPIPTQSAATGGSVGLTSCPAYAAGQHLLGSPGPPGIGVHSDPSLDWQGCGTVTLPLGTKRFMTGDNWQLGFATTCPNDLDYGPNGMGPNVVFNEILIDGSIGPDTENGNGPWTEGGGIVPHGGNYQLRVTSPDPRCRWHVAIYPS
jgi:hypothetical protein